MTIYVGNLVTAFSNKALIVERKGHPCLHQRFNMFVHDAIEFRASVLRRSKTMEPSIDLKFIGGGSHDNV